jgi:phage-related protein
MEMLAEKSETKAFLWQDPVGCKIIVDTKCLQVKNFKYLGCAISCEKENTPNKNQ